MFSMLILLLEYGICTVTNHHKMEKHKIKLLHSHRGGPQWPEMQNNVLIWFLLFCANVAFNATKDIL